jgi:hypothetical protein
MHEQLLSPSLLWRGPTKLKKSVRLALFAYRGSHQILAIEERDLQIHDQHGLHQVAADLIEDN